MADTQRQVDGDRAYFQLSTHGWDDIRPLVETRLRDLRARLDRVLDAPTMASPPSPAELALDLGAAARELFEVLAPGERDLREIITTLRTALALCWDMYSFPEAAKVSVQAHMERLKADIEGFEADLQQVQSGAEGQAGEG